MKRRDALLTALAAAFAPASLFAAPQGRMHRVGVLMITRTGDAELVRILVDRLAGAGFVVGRNLEILQESIEFKGERAGELARRLVNANPDVLYVTTEPLLEAVKAETSRIPIVFVFVTDPVERGYVREYSRPGGNITGVTDRYVEMGVKRLELLRETLPRAKRVAFVAHYDDPFGLSTWRAAAKRLGFEVIDADLAQRAISTQDALEKARAAGADCLLPIGSLKGLAKSEKDDPLSIFLRFAERYRLPAIFTSTAVVKQRGGLMSLDVDRSRIMQQGAEMVIRVLRGESAATMAIEQADRFTMAVNLVTAQALGIVIPQSVLLRTDEVIR